MPAFCGVSACCDRGVRDAYRARQEIVLIMLAAKWTAGGASRRLYRACNGILAFCFSCTGHAFLQKPVRFLPERHGDL